MNIKPTNLCRRFSLRSTLVCLNESSWIHFRSKLKVHIKDWLILIRMFVYIEIPSLKKYLPFFSFSSCSHDQLWICLNSTCNLFQTCQIHFEHLFGQVFVHLFITFCLNISSKIRLQKRYKVFISYLKQHNLINLDLSIALNKNEKWNSLRFSIIV